MKVRWTAIVIAMGLMGFWFYSISRHRPLATVQKTAHQKQSRPTSRTVSKVESSQVLPPSTPRQPAASPELNSLAAMTKTLSQFSQMGSRVQDLVRHLEQTQQRPIVGHDQNPDTGEMAVIRARSPLPGTRYFHAQYFQDENGAPFVQHMSFEYKPGPNAMQEAVAAVKAAFPDLQAPQTSRENFVEWKLPGGRVLWIKKMDKDDLQDGPHNAYTLKDIGTIRVAIELEVHEKE